MRTKDQAQINEKASDGVGGGQTGVSKSADPTGVRASLPISNLNNGEPMKKIQDPNSPGEEETSSETNTKPTADTSAQNKASIAMKEEDIKALFGSEELSEEFKEKAQTIFEAAVIAHMNEVKAQLEEQYEQKLENEIKEFVEETEARIDEYLNYVVDEWMQENEIAISESLRSDITEEFIEGLKKLFAENYIDIPEDKIDVISDLTTKVEELEAKLNEAVDNNIQMKKKVAEQTKAEIFAEVSEGLVTTQVEKFKTLAEGVDFIDEETYKRKLEIVKENYFAPKTGKDIVESEVDNAEEQPEDSSVKVTDPNLARYMSAISRTTKR